MKTVYFAKAMYFSALVMFAAAFMGQPAEAASPSFECSSSHYAAERAICDSWRLSRLDRRLDYWYGKALQRASYFDSIGWLRSAQRAWLRDRNSCGYSRRCLRIEYRSRIRALRRYASHV